MMARNAVQIAVLFVLIVDFMILMEMDTNGEESRAANFNPASTIFHDKDHTIITEQTWTREEKYGKTDKFSLSHKRASKIKTWRSTPICDPAKSTETLESKQWLTLVAMLEILNTLEAPYAISG